jgi:hypothetical protein
MTTTVRIEDKTGALISFADLPARSIEGERTPLPEVLVWGDGPVAEKIICLLVADRYAQTGSRPLYRECDRWVMINQPLRLSVDQAV